MRVTMRQIAEEAGVSVQAVSLALRGHPTVSQKLRRRVRAIADRLGYRPDPALSALVDHRRFGRSAEPSTLAVVANVRLREFAKPEFVRLLLRGARWRAERLGYRMAYFAQPDFGGMASLSRALEARGVRGVLLLPLEETVPVEGELVWDRFCVVSTDTAWSKRELLCVKVDHGANARLALEALWAAGSRQIALLVRPTLAEKNHRAYHAAYLDFALTHGMEPVIFPETKAWSPPNVRAWFAGLGVDTLLTCGPHFREWAGDAVRGRIIAELHLPAGERHRPGVRQNEALVGAVAVDQLHGMLVSHQPGVLRHPWSVLVPGRWAGG